MKMAQKCKKRQVFGHASQTCTKCHGPCKSPLPITPKQWAIVHKNGHKRKNDEFLVMPVIHVLSLMGLQNHPGNPKLWTIAHEIAQKHKNDGFLVIPLKHLVSVMGLVNHLENPKLWAIAHENGPKTQKR
jgi:hypothetical protein